MSVKGDDLQRILDSLTAQEQEKLHDATIVVTGCAGFLGYYMMGFLVEHAPRLGVRGIIGLDDFILGRPAWLDRLMESVQNDPRYDGINIAVHGFDIASDRLGDVAGAADADLVIHMASIASPSFYRTYPVETMDANIWGLRNLLDFYRDRDLAGLLFFSSSEIYGDPDPCHVPTSEDYNGNVSCTGPRACYDESKRFGETMCMEYARKFDIPIGVARPFNNYGPGMRLQDKRVVADFARAVMEGTDIVMLSDGTPTRTFCYVADAVAGYLKILLHGSYGYYNIGMDAPEISIAELARIYQEAGERVCGYRGSVHLQIPDEADYLTHNPQRRCPDITKARAELGFDPQVRVAEGVERYLRFLCEEQAEGLAW